MLKSNNRAKFKKGDKMRIYRHKNLFNKGYDTKWTDKRFIVYKINPSVPVTFKLKDINGKYIKDDFNQEELQETRMG